MPRLIWPLLLCVSLLSCKKEAVDDTGEAPDYRGIVHRENGWMRGDFHVHTEYEGGFEDVATSVRLGEYLEDPDFLAAHPEYTENHLDFLTLTDHRTVEQQSDPDYHSDRLVLVGGEEFGSAGHAGTHGVHTFVNHDPGGDGTDLADVQAAIDATHAQGGTFSPNHPLLLGIPWPWDSTGEDGIEIWNSGWGLMSPTFTADALDDWETKHGAASALFKRAVSTQGVTASEQSLTFYEAHLARGRHVAMIGGSDRHAVLLPGFPTTWVLATGGDETGILDGIRGRHTFVARNPAAAQVLVEVVRDGETWMMGDDVPVPAGGAEVTVRVRVGRAEGGLLRLISGGAVATDEDLLTAELGSVLREESVTSDDHTLELTLQVAPGDWLYPKVLEPLVAPGLTSEEADGIRALAADVIDTQPEDFLGIGVMFADLIDPEVLMHADECDAERWEPDLLQCALADDEGLATYFVPDRYDRAVNVVVEEGALTDWCMGAVGSAVLFVAE